MKKLTAERMLLLTAIFIIIFCTQVFDLTLVRENTVLNLHTENAKLKAENTILKAKNAVLETGKEGLVTQNNALLKEKEEIKEFIVSRGVGRISDIMPQDTGSEAILLIKKIELENNALRAFYKNTTGNEIEEVRAVKIESTMFTNVECGRPPSDPNYGKMASGLFAYHGAVAAPKDIPFDSTVIFTGENLKFGIDERIFSVGDRGGAIVNKDGSVCIDIWTDSQEIAALWGRNKQTEGYIIIPKGK